MLNSVTLAYLPQNSPPVVKSINVITQSVPAAQAGESRGSRLDRRLSASPSATPATPAPPPPPAPRRRRSRAPPASRSPSPGRPKIPITTAWSTASTSAPRTPAQWMLLKSGMHENSITLRRRHPRRRQVLLPRPRLRPRGQSAAQRARSAADQRARDDRQHAADRDHRRRSAMRGGSAHVEFEAVDAASPLRRCEYSLDAASWVPVQAADGVIDSHARAIRPRSHRPRPGRAPAGGPRRRQRQ